MVVSLPSASLIYALLVLVPGFLAFKVARRRGKITEEVDRFDKAIYTVIGSGVSISIVILAYFSVSGSQIQDLTEPQFTIYQISAVYMAMIATSLVVGQLVGWVVDWLVHHNSDVRNEPAWQLMLDGVEEPVRVRAVMNNGDEIWGEAVVMDSASHGQDVLLKYPEKITRGRRGNEVAKASVGDYVFLSEDGISHVYYEGKVALQNG